MIKKVLILAPHQDDELNLAGGILEDFIDHGIMVEVAFMTNGDYYPDVAEKRHKEMLRGMKLYGISKIHLLGYCDNVDKDHLFNYQNAVFETSWGNSETYGLGEINDFRYMISGFHNKYNRENLKNDIRDLLLHVRADLIISVDMDSHPDHRMLSIIFDEVMLELIIEKEYRPIILKGFAYLGVWQGKDDFFETYSQPTTPVCQARDETLYSCCLPYCWENRIRFRVSERIDEIYFWKSKLFKALNYYKTQRGYRHSTRVINADAVYWYKNTKNIALGCKITSSSGKTDFLNDFKLAIMTNISNKNTNNGIKKFDASSWTPETEDKEKSFTLVFEEPKSVSVIKLYQNFYELGHINNCRVTFSNGYVYDCQCEDGDETRIEIHKQQNIEWIKFEIVNGKGMCGLREFEVYEENDGFPWDEVPLNQYKEGKRRRYSSVLLSRGIWFFYLKMNDLYFKINRLRNRLKKS